MDTHPLSTCVYPGCRDIGGNPHLTRQVICTASRRHYRRVLDQLTLGYVQLRDQLPKGQGVSDGTPVRITSKEYGHPAEWASDLAREIADQLNEAHDGLAEHLSREPAPHPGVREQGRVAAAYQFLTVNFGDLCVYPAAEDTAVALYDLDKKVRRGLGTSIPRRHLHVPCPKCELLTLTRRLESVDDGVDCANCGYHIQPEHYGAWCGIVMDEILAI